MHCLIRRITRKSRTGVGHADETVEATSLTIGRATDQHVFLPDLHVALRHAVVREASGERFSVQAKTPSGVQINGRTVQTGTVHAGDRITVGRTEIRLLKPPRGIDLALEIDEAPMREGRQLDVGALSLRETWLRKRPWAWLLFLVILGFGLGVPFATIHDTPLPWAPAAQSTAPDAAAMDWHRLGGDRYWDSGPMSRAHRFFGRDCGSCHREPFQRVADAACLDCHRDLPHHADTPELLRAAGLGERRCANCHLEHNGTEGLVATAPGLCTDCHADPQRTMAGTATQPVSGFGGGGHPQFRVRLVAPGEDGGFEWHRVRMDQALGEDNGLVFPHDAHLAAEGIEGPRGREVLECGSCHRPDPRGMAMQPVRFEADCRRCHRLDFEPNDPRRQLPHGEPELVLAMLEEYYARVALAGGYRNPEAEPPEVVRRERPGGDELGERDRRAALDWAERWAATVATEVFEYRTCQTCHAVERRPDTPGGWQVGAVALTQDWMPGHDFSHDPHLGMACGDCHAAGDSQRSSDVLMPGIDTCRECHGDADSTARIASRCIDCHGFHAADELTMEARDVARSRQAQ